MKKAVGLYLHIPFCVSKCAYCDFASFAGRENDMIAYKEKVISEIREKQRDDLFLSTLYIGGGTPSIFPPDAMDEILTVLEETFPFAPEAEKSCECNPGTLTVPFLSVLRRHGVNRISMGAQASQPALLSLLGRIHTWQQVADSAQLLREMGFHNLNLDLMLGLPNQTLAHVEETLQKALALSPTHLSCYGLIVEEGTPMERQIASGIWTLPDEETEREEYERCRQMLSSHGFEQYEISNFAFPGFRCRHNMDCWQRKEYLGIGSAACGFLDGKRYQNPPELHDYLAGKAPEVTELSAAEACFESMMLGLRTMDGVAEDAFFRMHGLTIAQAFGSKLQKSIKNGLIRWENGRVCLTRKGMDLQNQVLVELL